MKRILAVFLMVISLFTCVALTSCNSSSTKEDECIVYEEKFLGKWSNEEGLFNFQYKDGVYCGGGISSDLGTVVFTKYTATKDVLTIYTDDSRVEKFDYKFNNGCLYIGDSRLERFN